MTSENVIKLALPLGRVDPFGMKTKDIRIGDILHCLSMQHRFNGYTRKPYSVAQHSVLVSRLAQVDHGKTGVSRAALVHDAVETYTGDIVLPLKRKLPEFLALEEKIERKVWKAFDLDYENDPLRAWVHHYDRVACQLEIENLLFYDAIPGGRKVSPKYREVAGPLLRPMSARKARRLLRRELASLGFGMTWCPLRPVLQGWKGYTLWELFVGSMAPFGPTVGKGSDMKGWAA